MRSLVRHHKYDLAYTISMALVVESDVASDDDDDDDSDSNEYSLPEACSEGEPYDGTFDLQRSSEGDGRPLLRSRTTDPPTLMPILALDSWRLITSPGVRVRGFILDGSFVLVSHSDITPGDWQMKEQQNMGNVALGTARSTTYAVGEKTMLIVPACFSDQDCDIAFASLSGSAISDQGDIMGYLEAVVGRANDYFDVASFHQFRLKATVAAPVKLTDVSSSTCGSFNHLGWYYGDWSSVDSMDARAYAAAQQQQGLYTHHYNFWVTVIPRCTGYSFSGIGWVGAPGVLLNLYSAHSYDPAFVHELGHNLGPHAAPSLVSMQRPPYRDAALRHSHSAAEPRSRAYSHIGSRTPASRLLCRHLPRDAVRLGQLRPRDR